MRDAFGEAETALRAISAYRGSTATGPFFFPESKGGGRGGGFKVLR